MAEQPKDDQIEWLERNARFMSSELEQLCNINSGSDYIEGLRSTSLWLQNHFSQLGVHFESIRLPTFESIDDSGKLTNRCTGELLRWNLHNNRRRSKDRKRILMSIHYDTVYGPTHSFQKCKWVGEDRLQGPGVIDAKGGIIVLLWALLAAKRAQILDKVDVTAILTPDEEIGSPASIHYWREIAKTFDFAMLYEPTAADGSLISERKGTGTFVFVVHGKSAHAGRNFDDGRNSVVHASRIALALHNLNGQRNGITVNVGRIRGGEAVNVVPDLAVLRANVRVATKEDQDWIDQQIREIMDRFQKSSWGLQIELHGGIYSAPKAIDAKTKYWMKSIEQVAESIDQRVQWKTSGGASDGNKLAALGLPNIDTFGPEGDLLHSSEEWVHLPSLPKKAALSYAFLKSLAKG